MRFSIFLALLVATFAVCFSSFASAEAGDIKLTGWYSDAASDEERDASKIAVSFVNTMKQGAARKAAQRASELAVKNSVLSQKEVQKMGKLLADAAVKEPKKWSPLKKIIVGMLGANAAMAVVFVAYKLIKSHAASTAGSSTAA
jgi:CRISPR/Cas system endoribonuclease Cas6 (RAMP superfamily)